MANTKMKPKVQEDSSYEYESSEYGYEYEYEYQYQYTYENEDGSDGYNAVDGYEAVEAVAIDHYGSPTKAPGFLIARTPIIPIRQKLIHFDYINETAGVLTACLPQTIRVTGLIYVLCLFSEIHMSSTKWS